MGRQNGESWSEHPLESENNGSPLMWLAIAGVLLALSVAVIIAIGNSRDPSGGADSPQSTIPTSTPAGGPGSPEDTPPMADPPPGSGSSEDTSPPDESSDEATTTASTATSVVTAAPTVPTPTSSSSP